MLTFKLFTDVNPNSFEDRVKEFLKTSGVKRDQIVKIYFSAASKTNPATGNTVVQHNANIAYEVKE